MFLRSWQRSCLLQFWSVSKTVWSAVLPLQRRIKRSSQIPCMNGFLVCKADRKREKNEWKDEKDMFWVDVFCWNRRATAHAADPGSGWWIFFLKVGMKAHWQVHFGGYQRCCAEPWLTPWSFWPTANQWQAWFHSTAVKWEGDFLHTVDGINHAPVDR